MNPTSLVPFLGFLSTPEDVVLFYYVLARVTGIFVISPLLSQQGAGGSYVRIFLSIFIAVLLTMTLYPEYRDHPSEYIFAGLSHQKFGWMILSLNLVKELAIGYILGFFFTLIFEAVVLAGELIDAMTGFATAASINPMSGTSSNLLGPLLTISAILIALAMDMHHQFIRIVVESFTVIPLGDYYFPPEIIDSVIAATGLFFSYALKFAAVPFVILACATIGIGFTVRAVPEYNPLLTGLPMRVLVAYFTLMLSISFVPSIMLHAFHEFEVLSGMIMRYISGG